MRVLDAFIIYIGRVLGVSRRILGASIFYKGSGCLYSKVLGVSRRIVGATRIVVVPLEGFPGCPYDSRVLGAYRWALGVINTSNQVPSYL